MKAIQVDGENLIWADFERPACGPGHLRIEVAASAINRADLMQRNGGYPPPPGASPIMGLECSGKPAPPEAITGMRTASAIMAVNPMS